MRPISLTSARTDFIKHRDKLSSEFQRTQPEQGYKADEGDGIIYVGGGKYWCGIEVGIRLLRQMGCSLPIQVWHRTCEKVYPERVEGMGVTFHPIYEYDNVKNGGWIAKLIALRFTYLSRVLFLDADAYCISNPLPLFDLLATNSFTYWRDLSSAANTIKWQYIYPEGATKSPPPVQGGQLLIDRIKAWKLIQTSYFICSYADHYFRYMYGDQDSWRVAMAGNPDYNDTLMVGLADWRAGAFVCSYDGTDYIVHRCQSKLFAPEDIPANKIKYSNPHYHLPKEVEVFNLLSKVLNEMPTDPKTRFTSIYQRKLWGWQPSGAGSRVNEALPYIQMVNGLIRLNGYTTVIDAGCGDGTVADRIDCESYIGIDCVDAIHRRTNGKKLFFPLDIYREYAIIPVGDILLCKDVLHHWPNEWVINWLARLIESKKWRKIVLCQDNQQKSEDQDCYLGGYRALDPGMHPLNLFPFKELKRYMHKSILALDL